MNDTDDAFAFFAIAQMAGAKPAWVSVRNASEPPDRSARWLFPGYDQISGRQHLRYLSVLHYTEQRLRLLGNRCESLLV